MAKFDVVFEDGSLKAKVDPNEDGQAVVDLDLVVSEALEESLKRGDNPEMPDAKVVDFKFEGGKLSVVLDTDKDGQRLLSLNVDLAEALDEVGLMGNN